MRWAVGLQDDMPAGEARRLIGPGLILGVSVKTAEQAAAALAAGADYLGAGACAPPLRSPQPVLACATWQQMP